MQILLKLIENQLARFSLVQFSGIQITLAVKLDGTEWRNETKN